MPGLAAPLPFDQSNPEYLNKIIQVNIKATALLTRLLLPNLKQCESAYVLYVSSVAAFSPVGYKTIYPASKAFVHCFSRSLNAELSNSNVFISVIHSGPLATNKYIIDRIARKGWLGRVSTQHPDRIARFALDRLQKKDSVIMVAPLLWLLSAILPIWIKLPLMTSIVRKELSNETSAGNRS